METTGMTVIENGQVTVGNITTSNCIQTWPWDNGHTYWPYSQVVTTTPYFCSGNVHVFGCDNAEKCKCGQSKRKVVPPICPHCGKTHN